MFELHYESKNLNDNGTTFRQVNTNEKGFKTLEKAIEYWEKKKITDYYYAVSLTHRIYEVVDGEKKLVNEWKGDSYE